LIHQATVLAIASGVGLLLLLLVMAAADALARRRLAALQRSAAEGLLGQARALVPTPLAGSDFETVVDALDDGDADMARGANRRLERQVGRFRVTGWWMLPPAVLPMAGLPLLPAILAAWQARSGGGFASSEVWSATATGFALMGALLPLALAVGSLALHLHRAEEARRTAAAAGLLHHAGKELR